MHILIITQYFTPEIGAASERLSGIAFHLRKLGHKVTVITGFPNYPFGRRYPGYKRKFFSVEMRNEIRIIRVWLFMTRKKGPAARLFNYLSFMVSSFLAGLCTGNADSVVATSGPLFAAVSGYLLSLEKRASFFFDVRDIWPERIYAGTQIRRGFIIKTLEKLEIFLYKKAAQIIAVTNGVKNNIVSKGISPEKITVITNGVDTEIFRPCPQKKELMDTLTINADDFIVMYVGTLGLLQDLELIAACAERLKGYKDILFLIIGEGAKRDEFIATIKKKRLSRIKVFPPVSPEKLCHYINLCNVGINANTEHPHNNMAIPVKIFPYMACAKPIILANCGEIARIVEKYSVGQCVAPGDVEAFTTAILHYYHNREAGRRCGKNGYKLVGENFSIDIIAKSMSNVLTQCKKA